MCVCVCVCVVVVLGGICVVVVVVSEEWLMYGRKFSRRNANVQVRNRVSEQIIKIKQYVSLLYRSIYNTTRLKAHYTKLFTSIVHNMYSNILSIETTV